MTSLVNVYEVEYDGAKWITKSSWSGEDLDDVLKCALSNTRPTKCMNLPVSTIKTMMKNSNFNIVAAKQIGRQAVYQLVGMNMPPYLFEYMAGNYLMGLWGDVLPVHWVCDMPYEVFMPLCRFTSHAIEPHKQSMTTNVEKSKPSQKTDKISCCGLCECELE